MDSQVDALKLEGNAFYSKKNYVAAIRKYSDALELDPTNAVILSNRCAVYLSIQEYEKAVADATWSVHANPSAGNIKAYYRLASAQNKLKNNGISLKTIQEGLRVLGENSDSNGVETSSWALQRSSLIKLQETVKADLKKQRIEQRKQVFFGGNLTECLACSDNSIDGGVCVEECCVNNLYASTQGSGNKLKPKKKKSPTNATVTGPPQPPSSLGTGGALPPAPPNTNKRSACAEEAPVLTATEYDMLSEVKSIMRKVRAGDFAYSKISGGEVDMLAGSFHNLVSGETAFQETLFPGCSSKVRKTLPKNLKELVLWKFDLSGESGGGSNQQQQVQLFNDEVLEYELYPKIYKSAASVLDNLVAKSDVQEAQMRQMQGTQTQSRRSKAIAGAGPGKSEPEPGSIHHPATRSLLVTQITQEAFARELIAYVHAQNRKLSGIKAKTMLNMAVISSQNANTPQARQIANSNHLSERTVSKLNAYAASMDKPVVQQAVKAGDVDLLVSVQDAYMGPEWVELLADDLQRYVADEKMTTVDVNATNAAAPSTRVGAGEVVKMCWVDRDIEGPGGEEASLGVSYPAITELLDNLHSLPYEINSKLLSITSDVLVGLMLHMGSELIRSSSVCLTYLELVPCLFVATQGKLTVSWSYWNLLAAQHCSHTTLREQLPVMSRPTFRWIQITLLNLSVRR